MEEILISAISSIIVSLFSCLFFVLLLKRHTNKKIQEIRDFSQTLIRDKYGRNF